VKAKVDLAGSFGKSAPASALRRKPRT